jgi:hypothetical protein
MSSNIKRDQPKRDQPNNKKIMRELTQAFYGGRDTLIKLLINGLKIF